MKRQRLASLLLGAVATVLCLVVANWVVGRAGVLEYPPAMNTGHPRRGYALRPGFEGKTSLGVPIRINSIGLRSPEVAIPKPPGVRRVLVLGDSLTFGAGVPEEVTFSRRLETSLRHELACPVEVVNAGDSGYGSVEEAEYFESEGQALEPDVVLVYHIENDNEVIAHFQGEIASFLKDQIVYRWNLVEGVLYAFRMARWKLEARAAGGDQAAYAHEQQAWDQRPGTQQSLDALREIASLAARSGARVILVSHPSKVADPSIDAVRDARLRALAAETGMTFVELGPMLAPYADRPIAVSRTDLHPSAFLHGIIADKLRPAVRDALGCEPRAAGAGS